MKMTFTVVTFKGEQHTSEAIDNIDNWNIGIEHAVVYAQKMSRNLKKPVKIHSIQRIDT